MTSPLRLNLYSGVGLWPAATPLRGRSFRQDARTSCFRAKNGQGGRGPARWRPAAHRPPPTEARPANPREKPKPRRQNHLPVRQGQRRPSALTEHERDPVRHARGPRPSLRCRDPHENDSACPSFYRAKSGPPRRAPLPKVVRGLAAPPIRCRECRIEEAPLSKMRQGSTGQVEVTAGTPSHRQVMSDNGRAGSTYGVFDWRTRRFA